MKNTVYYTMVLLTATLMLSLFPTDAEAKIYEDTVRLHILANSDREDDQQLKLKIRDKVLLKYGEALACSGSLDEAMEKTEALLDQIEKDAEKWIKELGYSYSARATLTTEWYETRDYDDFSLPCGYYNSLRIIIGEGEGKNWWCVMYPPLCMDIATENAPEDDGLIDYTREELTLIKSGKYNVKFKILEDLSRVFAKNG